MGITGTDSHLTRTDGGPPCGKSRNNTLKILADIGLCLNGKRQDQKCKYRDKGFLVIHVFSVFFILINIDFFEAAKLKKIFQLTICVSTILPIEKDSVFLQFMNFGS